MMRKLRRSGGTSIAELGPTLFMLFIVFAFPLAALASIGVKYIFLLNATKQAADAGSRCKFWNSGRGPSQNSVVQTVLTMAQKGVSSFSGVTMIGFPQISVFEGDPPSIDLASLICALCRLPRPILKRFSRCRSASERNSIRLLPMAATSFQFPV